MSFVIEKEASAKINYTLVVKIQGDAKKDVSVEVRGENLKTPQTQTTKATGIVKFPKLDKGTYTVTPTKEGYSFTPSFKDISFKRKRTETASFTVSANSIVAEESIAVSNLQMGLILLRERNR